MLVKSVSYSVYNPSYKSASLKVPFKSSPAPLYILSGNKIPVSNFHLIKKFSNNAMNERNPKWLNAISRNGTLPPKDGDMRTEFERDGDRIMYCEGFDKMRYKTQSFTLKDKEAISSRSSHVNQVANIAKDISRRFGLNEELTEAIALGHDLGHAPFGHAGEAVLNQIAKNASLETFWHEKNGLRAIDYIYTLPDIYGNLNNMFLTYAVRDGIVNHCGEVDDNFIMPRDNVINLEDIQKNARPAPYTWEGIVVKIADKIAYLGKDVEDALALGVINEDNINDLTNMIKKHYPDFRGKANNTNLINLFINDIANNSSPTKGIGFSKEGAELISEIKNYNYKNIYLVESEVNMQDDAVYKILSEIFNFYAAFYSKEDTISALENAKNIYCSDFKNYLQKYIQTKPDIYKNKVIYCLSDEKSYNQAIVDYISAMTDNRAYSTYEFITDNKCSNDT